VDKFVGDSIMAFWGAPKSLSTHSRSAVEAVIEIREWLEKANHTWRAEGLPAFADPIRTCFGGSHGGQRWGVSPRTVFGGPVNLAQRLEASIQLKTSVLVIKRSRGSRR
jgi:adenylate cyclase